MIFLSLREGDMIAPAALRKYRTFAKQLHAFAASSGYIILDQWASANVDSFYGSLRLDAWPKGKRLGTLRSFFRFCINRKWLPENPVSSDLKPPLGANRVANKIPFSDVELEQIILSACDTLGAIRWINEQGEGRWTGEDVKDFISTPTYTGLHISDMCPRNLQMSKGVRQSACRFPKN